MAAINNQNEHRTTIVHEATLYKDLAGVSSVNHYLIEEKMAPNVKKVLDLDDMHEYAMKIFKRGGSQDQFSKEVYLLDQIPPHRNIVRFLEAIDDPHVPKLYIVMELADGGQITHVDARSGECDRTYRISEAASLVRQLAEGIAHMHDHGVIHRDLKPENVLLDDHGRVIIADFGESASFVPPNHDHVFAPNGRSPAYSAPESFSMRDGYHGTLADAWGIGVIAFCIIFGRLPFWATTLYQTMLAILYTPLEIPLGTPARVRHFLMHALEKDPSKRLSVSQMLSHPWLSALCPASPKAGGSPTPTPTAPPSPSSGSAPKSNPSIIAANFFPQLRPSNRNLRLSSLAVEIGATPMPPPPPPQPPPAPSASSFSISAAPPQSPISVESRPVRRHARIPSCDSRFPIIFNPKRGNGVVR